MSCQVDERGSQNIQRARQQDRRSLASRDRCICWRLPSIPTRRLPRPRCRRICERSIVASNHVFLPPRATTTNAIANNNAFAFHANFSSTNAPRLIRSINGTPVIFRSCGSAEPLRRAREPERQSEGRSRPRTRATPTQDACADGRDRRRTGRRELTRMEQPCPAVPEC